MPPSLLGKPENRAEYEWFFDLYNTLSRFRGWDEGVPTPISLSDLFSYLDELRVTDREYRRFLTSLVAQMDSVYITHFSEVRKQKLDEAKNKKR